MKPAIDLCWVCQKNASAAKRALTEDAEVRSAVSEATIKHIQTFKLERPVYTAVCEETKRALLLTSALGEHPAIHGIARCIILGPKKLLHDDVPPMAGAHWAAYKDHALFFWIWWVTPNLVVIGVSHGSEKVLKNQGVDSLGLWRKLLRIRPEETLPSFAEMKEISFLLLCSPQDSVRSENGTCTMRSESLLLQKSKT
ncbi:hypothetical protein RRG08_059605 [Elysia crispata]|uniref:Uncharacterized protein n=1 Tax=Elysia crispata TaxID=231223 RepID=A0AAE1AYE7_9GAST|nr:hypothetical protein RRG08_059605 [Elysia crispata]